MDNESVTIETPARRRRRNGRGFIETLHTLGETSQAANVDVGHCLRQIRSAQGLSIRALAEKSQLNVNTLSMIENGKTSPSVSTLQQLAFALQVPVTSFFESDGAKREIAFHKANQRRRMSFAHGTMEDLGAGLVGRGAEPFLVVLGSHANSGETAIVHTGREFVYCLEGQLAYTIGEEDFVLEPGDSLVFAAYLPHRWKNMGDTPSRSLLVLCPADENDRPTERHFAV